MEELLCEPGPDRLGFSSLIGIGDRFQRAMLRDPCQVSLDGEPGAVWIDIAPCLLLALSPETPALGGPHQASMTDAVDVPEVPGTAALHQRDHLARHQIGQAVERNVAPGESGRRLELGGTRGDLKAEDRLPAFFQLKADDLTPFAGTYLSEGLQGCFDRSQDALSIFGECRRGPPSVDVMGGPVVQIVQQA